MTFIQSSRFFQVIFKISQIPGFSMFFCLNSQIPGYSRIFGHPAISFSHIFLTCGLNNSDLSKVTTKNLGEVELNDIFLFDSASICPLCSLHIVGGFIK